MFWLLARVVFSHPALLWRRQQVCALLGFFFFFIIYCSSPFVFVLASSLLVFMLEELVATDGNHGDECHELLEVTLGVAVGVQALHQAVKCGLVFHMLQGEDGQFTSGHTKPFFICLEEDRLEFKSNHWIRMIFFVICRGLKFALSDLHGSNCNYFIFCWVVDLQRPRTNTCSAVKVQYNPVSTDLVSPVQRTV